jgi:hypothetical protein
VSSAYPCKLEENRQAPLGVIHRFCYEVRQLMILFPRPQRWVKGGRSGEPQKSGLSREHLSKPLCPPIMMADRAFVTQRAFQQRAFAQIPFFSWIKELLVSYLTDSLYPADGLEEVLKEVFGLNRSIDGCSHATHSGTKVSLPVTTVPESSSCLFTNYNGVGSRAADCGEWGVEV